MSLEILYHDAHFVVINKPSGLLVHRSPIDRHETRFALQMLRDQIGQRVYPVHRLDKPTSGVLLFGLSAEAAHKAQQVMQADKVKKTYYAIVRGYTPEYLDIDHPVKTITDAYDDKTADSHKPARTLLKTLAHCEIPISVDKYPMSRYSLVQLQPITGRRHQLRYHLKHISHPIIGDAKYGKGNHNRMFQQAFGLKRLLLAATNIQLMHPFTQEALNIYAPLEDSFLTVMNALPWSYNNTDNDMLAGLRHAG